MLFSILIGDLVLSSENFSSCSILVAWQPMDHVSIRGLNHFCKAAFTKRRIHKYILQNWLRQPDGDRKVSCWCSQTPQRYTEVEFLYFVIYILVKKKRQGISSWHFREFSKETFKNDNFLHLAQEVPSVSFLHPHSLEASRA